MTMTANADIAIVQKFFEGIYAGELEAAFEACAQPDYRFVVGSSANEELNAAMPWGGVTHSGKQGFLKLTTRLFSEFEALEFDLRRFCAAQSQVFVEGHFVFRHRETGKIADSDFLARFDMKDGRIAGGQFYENTFAVAAARKPN
jgi:ketosteroid isomerase-like protein